VVRLTRVRNANAHRLFSWFLRRPQLRSFALRLPLTFDALGWPCQKQNDKNHQRSEKKRKKECADEAHAPLAATDSDENAEQNVCD
jgi:hypothetical protein